MNPIVKPSFWSDADIESQPSDNKLVLLWLITNGQTNVLGICHASPARFQFETGLTPDKLHKACEGLGRSLKVFGNKIFIVNYIRHQFGDGEKLKANNIFKGICSKLSAVKCDKIREAILTEYPLLFEGLPKPLPSPKPPVGVREGEGVRVPGDSKGGKIDDGEILAKKVIDHLNTSAGRRFNPDSPESLKLVRCRLEEVGWDVDGVFKMIDRWVEKWKGTEQEEYLQPSTLFGVKKFRERYDMRDAPLFKEQPDQQKGQPSPDHVFRGGRWIRRNLIGPNI